MIGNIATYFILADKYVILNAVEELITNIAAPQALI